MRVRLRPYHPTWVACFFGLGGMAEGYNKDGFNYQEKYAAGLEALQRFLAEGTGPSDLDASDT